MSGCLENFPSELEPSLSCLSDSLSSGPASGVLILAIGIPLIGIVKAYMRKLLDNLDFDEGLENFLYRIAGVALWALVILTAADEFGINVTGLVVGLGFIGLAVAFAAQTPSRTLSQEFSSSLTGHSGRVRGSYYRRAWGGPTRSGGT